jgi:hypothetical protein
MAARLQLWDVGGKSRLAFPVGKVLYQTGGWISHPRVRQAAILSPTLITL